MSLHAFFNAAAAIKARRGKKTPSKKVQFELENTKKVSQEQSKSKPVSKKPV
jgi:hypothetical protein